MNTTRELHSTRWWLLGTWWKASSVAARPSAHASSSARQSNCTLYNPTRAAKSAADGAFAPVAPLLPAGTQDARALRHDVTGFSSPTRVMGLPRNGCTAFQAWHAHVDASEASPARAAHPVARDRWCSAPRRSSSQTWRSWRCGLTMAPTAWPHTHSASPHHRHTPGGTRLRSASVSGMRATAADAQRWAAASEPRSNAPRARRTHNSTPSVSFSAAPRA